MRTIKKRHLAILALSFAVAGAGISAAYAASDDSEKNQISSLVTAIAAKFNLDKDEVRAVFDEQRKEMQAERETRMAEIQKKINQDFAAKLAQAVADGKLTQSQANLITDKRAELAATRATIKPEMETQKEMTGEERAAQREKMQTRMEDLKSWAADNNIPEEYLPMLGGWGGHGGRGLGGACGQRETAATASNAE
jgi:hypothetical protein